MNRGVRVVSLRFKVGVRVTMQAESAGGFTLGMVRRRLLLLFLFLLLLVIYSQ